MSKKNQKLFKKTNTRPIDARMAIEVTPDDYCNVTVFWKQCIYTFEVCNATDNRHELEVSFPTLHEGNLHSWMRFYADSKIDSYHM